MSFFTAMTWCGITLGGYIWPKVSMTQRLTKCQPDPKPDLWVGEYMWPEVSLAKVVTHFATRCLCLGGYIWPKVILSKAVPKLAMRCLYRGVHLTRGLCDQSSHTLGHMMSLPRGRARLTFCSIGSQPSSQLASCTTLLLRNYFSNHKSEMLWKKVWPKVHLPKVVTHLAMRYLYWGGGRGLGHLGWGVWGRGYIWPKVILPKVVLNLAMRCLYTGGMGAGGGHVGQEGHGGRRGLWGVGCGVHLTTGYPDPKIWQKCQPDLKPQLWVGWQSGGRE